MQSNEQTRLLTRTEVEERFGVSKRFLELAITRGEGPAYIRIGRSVRYDVEDIRTWLSDNRVVPPGTGR